MPDNDDILKRIREQAYAQAQGSSGGVPPPASPADLAQQCLGDRWLRPPHLELLNRELVGAAEGKLAAQGYTGLIVMEPPRHGKSTLISEYFPPWFLGRNPTWQVLLVSSEADFATEWGRRGRDILKEHGPRIFGVTVREDSAAAERWAIAGHGGGMATAGVGGQITGRGAHCLIIEDPIKNAEQAQSALFRDKLWEWYNSTARPRLEPGGFIVLVMARWHEDDLAGRLIRQMQADASADRFKIIQLPALAEENDLLGRKPGDPLWPERYDFAALDKIRHSVGFRIWSALYQQKPCSIEGVKFRRERFGFVDTSPALVKAVRFWDTAATEATQDSDPDWTVGAKLGVDRFNRATILDVRRLRGRPEQVEEFVRRTAIEDGITVAVRIEQEPGAAGLIAVDHYQRRVLPGFDVRGVPANGNKVSRAKPLSEFAESGNLLLLRASWNAVLLDELEAFPNGLHDDQVDACSGAFAELGVMATAMPEVQTDADKLRVEPLAYVLGLKLCRVWYLSGPLLCCVWFQVEPICGDQVRVKVLLEMHSDTEWASSFVGQVLETTRKQYRAAQHPHDILIVPKSPYDDDTKENISALWKHGVHARHTRWDPEQFNAVFGEILEAGAVSVDKGCPAIVEAIRGGCGRKRSGGVAVDSYLEPLARSVIGGITGVFTVAQPPLE